MTTTVIPSGLREALRHEIDAATRRHVTRQPAPADKQARAREIQAQAQRILTSDRYQRMLNACQHTSTEVDAQMHVALICAGLDSVEQARINKQTPPRSLAETCATGSDRKEP